jgi:hypothetical protein
MSAMALAKTRHPRPKRVGKNSTFGEKSAARLHSVLAQMFGGRTVLKLVGIFVAVVIIASSILWYKKVFTNPERVFWSTINNNLSTASVSKQISQQAQSTKNVEITQIAFSPTPAVRDIKDLTTQNSANNSRIIIESLGTPTDTYQHYALIQQKSKTSNKKLNYSSVYPLWLKNSGNKQQETQLFSNAIYSALLFGNLQSTQRGKTVDQLRDVYKVNFKTVDKSTVKGRKTYTYNVNLKLRKYAEAVNSYAKTIGLPNTNQINAANYKPTDEISIQVSIDVLSRQVKKVYYTSNGSTEEYLTYGVVPTFKLPAHTVGYETLQKAFEKASKQ